MSNELKFKTTVIKNRFNSDEYKIYVVKVDNSIYKKVQGNKNNEFVIVGNMPNLIPDVEYDIIANPEINKTYGVQYKVKSVRRDKPTDYNSSKNFLNEILNENQSNTLLEVYPDIIDKIVKNDLDDIDLSKTKGIKEFTFEKIKSKVIENFCLIELVDVFGGLIEISVMKKLYDKYSNISIIKKELKKDPYRCLCKLSRIGFKTADGILLNLEEQNKNNPEKFKFKFGYELKHSIQRMKSCLNYILEENEASGNTKMTLKEARANCGKLVPQCIDLFVKVIKENEEDIHVDLKTKTISTTQAYNTELDISNFVKTMINKTTNKWNVNTELYREVEGMSMTDEQLSTLNMMCNNNIGILTAPAGSGKSASVKALINMLDDINKTYMLMTPTGASSKVLKEYTDRECGTIHRQLKYKPSSGINSWGYNKENPIPVDIVIIDEFSMVDIFLFKNVINAIDTNKTKILFVFDSFQLASVGCGNIAQDLLSSKVVPTVILTKIFRYAEGGLMQVVTNIRNGVKFLENDFKGTKIFGTKKDFIFCQLPDSQIPRQVLGIYKKLLADNYELQDIMVLTSQNKGDYGTKAINKHIQALMQKIKKTNFIMRGDTKFHKGDKIIQIINNYKAITPTGEETSIFNGNTGIVIDVSYNEIQVDFGDCVIVYAKAELNQIELGYCISIHKSQGASAKQVITIAPKSHSFMLNSNLLYVAPTRAKERCFLLGNISTINSAIRKKENLNRNTYLTEILVSFK